MRIIDFFDKAVLNNPDRKAFVSAEGDYTYAEMQSFSNKIAVAMSTGGLTDLARVAVYSPNNIDAFACILATFRAGGTWVPINAKNMLDANIDFMNLTECEWLYYHSSFSDIIAEIKEQVPSMQHLICIDGDDSQSPSLADYIAVTASPHFSCGTPITAQFSTEEWPFIAFSTSAENTLNPPVIIMSFIRSTI